MTPTKMQALVYHAPGDIRLEIVDVPACGPGELRLTVDACAVCGTDLKTWHKGNPRIEPPRVMGHEFTGLVETVGEGVRGFAIGERVVMATSVSCGACYYCNRGWNNLCVELAPMGFAYDGGMARYVTVPARAVRNGHVLKVPAGVSAVHAALAEPVSCTVNACEHCRIEPGDTVVVIGAGPMGIINACVSREFGAGRVIVSEVNAARRTQAAEFGFDRIVNPAAEDLPAIIREMTGGLMADVVIVAAPAAAPQEQAPALVRKRGTVCLFASLPAGKSAITVDSRTIHYGEVRVLGTSDSTPAQVARAVELIAGGRLPVDRLASHVLGLDGLQQAYALMTSGEALRVVLIPDGD
ncbi:MAG: alcohol dehydrogenase catalytic domain-containing protein [Thermoguttaceae bacterium]